MKHQTLLDLLQEVPRTSLDILKMAQEATRPDGSIDFDAVVAQEDRLTLAASEAQNQARGAQRLAKGVLWKMRA